MEAARGVVWDHGEVEVGRGSKKRRARKYVVALVLVTDEEVPCAVQGSDACNMGVRDGAAFTRELGALLQKYRAPRRLGDANDVLTSCGEWPALKMEEVVQMRPVVRK